MTSDLPVIVPPWPAPPGVKAACTTRGGGVSQAPWASFNLGSHVGDAPEDVLENRRRLGTWAGVDEARFGWLEQVHGAEAVELPAVGVPRADASFTSEPGTVCVVLTADCLPVLLCDTEGTRVAAAHAGWRGLCDGVLERTVEHLGNPARLMAWLGPAISPGQFEVGPEVREAFVLADPAAATAFSPAVRSGHFMADIYQLARQRLANAGVLQVYGGEYCTVSDPALFYSYRRDGQTGRMASFVWLEA